MISGQGSSPAELIKISKPKEDGKYEEFCVRKFLERPNSFQYQASKTVEGVLLQKLLIEKPQLLEHINPENYTFLFLLSLLTNLQDGKPDNFIGKFLG